MAHYRPRVGLLATHPIQYYVPWYRAMAQVFDIEVFYCQKQTPEGQASAGFGVHFDWDVPLLEGYSYRFLVNRSQRPNVSTFWGCDTPEIGSIIRKGRFDAFIVHGWAVKSFWQAVIACWRSGTPVLVRGDSQLSVCHSRVWEFAKTPLYRAFIPRFDAYLVVGERAREYLLHYGARADRMFSSPHAVDNDFFAAHTDAFRSQRKTLREKFGLPDDAAVFLFAGKFIQKKRPWDFVTAIAEAARRQPRVWGLMAGDGELRTNLQRIAEKENWPIRFVGFLNQTAIPKAYAVSDALVLPSTRQETWGLVVNEAMASGLPAIVSDAVGCMPDLVHAGETGEVFRCGEIAELSAILLRLTTNPEYLRQLGAEARRHIARYSLAQTVLGTEAAIEKVTRSDQSLTSTSSAQVGTHGTN